MYFLRINLLELKTNDYVNISKIADNINPNGFFYTTKEKLNKALAAIKNKNYIYEVQEVQKQEQKK